MTSTKQSVVAHGESEGASVSPEYVKELEKKVHQLEDTEKAILNVLEDARLLEDQLHRQTEERESILRFLRSIGDGVIAVDLGGNILFVNETAARLLVPDGNSSEISEAMKGARCPEVFSLESEKAPHMSVDFLERVIQEGKVFEDTRGVLARKSGGQIPVAYSVSPIHGEGDRLLGCMIVLKDMTEEREVDNAKDRFLSVAAHQLRTPLSGMRWSMEMVLNGDSGDVSAEVKQTVARIHENTIRMIALINDLLNVALLDAGQDPESAEPVAVKETLADVFQELKPYADKSNIVLEFSAPREASEWHVLSLPRRLYEVCENLVHNAVKYSRTNSSVTVALESVTSDRCRISVKDNGIGIPKGDCDKIFGKFFRASNAFRWKTEGSGLGLAVVKSFVEEMGGHVSFESEEEKGTVFIVELPLVKSCKK
jgi:PAS domain S-box-containing protein